MNALADKVYIQTRIFTPYHGHISQQLSLYISSSGTQVINLLLLICREGWLVNVAMLWSA